MNYFCILSFVLFPLILCRSLFVIVLKSGIVCKFHSNPIHLALIFFLSSASPKRFRISFSFFLATILPLFPSNILLSIFLNHISNFSSSGSTFRFHILLLVLLLFSIDRDLPFWRFSLNLLSCSLLLPVYFLLSGLVSKFAS